MYTLMIFGKGRESKMMKCLVRSVPDRAYSKQCWKPVTSTSKWNEHTGVSNELKNTSMGLDDALAMLLADK